MGSSHGFQSFFLDMECVPTVFMCWSMQPGLPTDQLQVVRCQVWCEVMCSMFKLYLIKVMVVEIQGQIEMRYGVCTREASRNVFDNE